jgi:hypothetical protein
MEVMKELEKPEMAAAAGAVGALIVAMFVPAALILGAGAATVGGMYLYNKKFAQPKAAKDEVIDATPVSVNKEEK